MEDLLMFIFYQYSSLGNKKQERTEVRS